MKRLQGAGIKRLLLTACAVGFGAAGSAPAQAPSCNQAPDPGCLYFPRESFVFAEFERSTVYTDNAGEQREVSFLIRQPLGAPLPMPAVIWSHGGADGKRSPRTSMVEWSESTARAGYFTLSIAHPHRNPESRRRLCRSIGITEEETCTAFKYLNWDRPHDDRAVLDELERLAADEFTAQVDMGRVAIGGHSAGSGGLLTLAGARRIFVDEPVALVDDRPVAFLAFSPQQPGSEGFFDTRFGKPRHSWTDVRRPVLFATGDGDSTCVAGPSPGSCAGDTPYGRRIAFHRVAADGNKYLLYLHDADAFHTIFQLNETKCSLPEVDASRCREMVRWLSSAVLAFLDGHVRGLPAALQWLRSNRIESASGGIAEWQRK